jgi:hypothetical protein
VPKSQNGGRDDQASFQDDFDEPQSAGSHTSLPSLPIKLLKNVIALDWDDNVEQIFVIKFYPYQCGFRINPRPLIPIRLLFPLLLLQRHPHLQIRYCLPQLPLDAP